MIPTEIQCLLQLGSNFISLRITQKKEVKYSEFIKNIENNINKLVHITKNYSYKTRNYSISIIENIAFFSHTYNINSINHRLSYLIKSTNIFTKNNHQYQLNIY